MSPKAALSIALMSSMPSEMQGQMLIRLICTNNNSNRATTSSHLYVVSPRNLLYGEVERAKRSLMACEKEPLILRCGGVGKTWCRDLESTPGYDDGKHEVYSCPIHEIYLSLSYKLLRYKAPQRDATRRRTRNDY